MWFYGWESLVVSHDPAKFGDHRHCGSGDIMFLVGEGENSRCFRYNRHYCSTRHCCLFLKDMGWKHTAYHIINADPSHTRSKEQLEKILKITFPKLSRKSDEKEKKKKKTNKLEWQLQSFLHFTQTQKYMLALLRFQCLPHYTLYQRMRACFNL